MNFASFAPLVSSSTSPALLPLQSLFRFFFASSTYSQPNLQDKRPGNRTLCQPAFLKPSLKLGLNPGLKSGIAQRLADTHPAAGPRQSASAHGTSAVAKPQCQKPALRVVRMLESGQSPKSVGRMVISGRMADVCAELDRLVGKEQPARQESIH
jgi:hypothetical protein